MSEFTTKIKINITFPSFAKTLKLFHGSRDGIKGNPSINYSGLKNNGDFGKGFYLGSNKGQAASLVSSEHNPVLYTFDFAPDNLICAKLSDEAWLFFIALNRGWFEKSISDFLKQKIFNEIADCDVIFGEIADDRMETILIEFHNDNITDKAFAACLRCANLGMQYVLKTEKACAALKEMSREKLSSMRKKQISCSSYNLWSDNIRKMDEIKKIYLRSGKYFSEITDEIREEINARQSHSLYL